MKILPFRIAIDDADIVDLKSRLLATRWPSEVEGAGWSMGTDSAYLRSIAEYWRSQFDWRAAEEALNQVPQFQAITNNGTVHFAHIRSNHQNAVPIVLTHGWPSTFAELLALGFTLANPRNSVAESVVPFDVVIPSLPGYAFSSAPKALGTDLFAVADQWADLMRALGYQRFVAHGGDIGAGVSTALALRHSDRLLGLHLNFIPSSYAPHLATALTSEESDSLAKRADWAESEGGYSHVQRTKPDTLGPALNDSPAGLAAWIIDKFRTWSDCDGDVERRFSRDELLTTISLYWFTRCMPSAMRMYWEMRRGPLKLKSGEKIDVPVGFAHFPKELPIPHKSYIERGYNLVRYRQMPKGGHFAALEQPELLAHEIRAFTMQVTRPGANGGVLYE